MLPELHSFVSVATGRLRRLLPPARSGLAGETTPELTEATGSATDRLARTAVARPAAGRRGIADEEVGIQNHFSSFL